MSLHCFYAEVAAAVLPLWPQLECGQVCSENKLLTQKNRLKRRFFQVKWSEMGDSNSRHLAPKPMSQPSGRPVAPSLALSVAPAVPLWNSFGLFISDTAFVFWDLCGIEFCILKVLPTGFTSNSGCLSAESSSKIAPHKQRNKRDDTRQQADLDHSQPAERRWLFDVLPFSGNACSFA